jgi:pyruvate/2-oxoglutarate/acetoin dehydrogenase E1 component
VDEAFWALDAPVERVCVEDVPMPYDPGLLQAVLPSTEMIRERMEKVASV